MLFMESYIQNCASAMQGTWAQSLGWEDPLEEETATHSSILAQKIPWTEKPCGLQSMGSQLDMTQGLSTSTTSGQNKENYVYSILLEV